MHLPVVCMPALATQLKLIMLLVCRCSKNDRMLNQIALALLTPDASLLQLLPHAVLSAPAAVQTALARKLRAVKGFQLLEQFIRHNKPELLSWLLDRFDSNFLTQMSIVDEQRLALPGSSNLQQPLIELAAITGNSGCTEVCRTCCERS